MTIVLDGTSGITTPTYGGNVTAEYLVPVTSFKNRIINGAMMIDQRNAGASVPVVSTGFGYLTVDRFRVNNQTDGALTYQQSSTAPAGFKNSVVATVTTADTSIAAAQYSFLQQSIEGYNVADLNFGSANAATVTLSFWVRSSLTGTYGGSLANATPNRSYPFSYTINAANTWEQKTITVVGDTTGTWATDNTAGLNVFFTLACGANSAGTANTWAAAAYLGVSGQANLMATVGNTFYITGVQLEKGTTATSFDYRPYGTELELCQRYYQAIYGDATGLPLIICGYGPAGGQVSDTAYMIYPVVMRAAPTATQVGTWPSSNLQGFGFGCITKAFTNAYVVAAAAGTAYTYASTTSSGFTWSAEL